MKKRTTVLTLIILLLLVSCAQVLNEDQEFIPPSTMPVETFLPMVTSTPRWFDTILTPPAMWPIPPNDVAILDTTKQTTDGNLVVYAREVEPRCHQYNGFDTWNMDVEFVFLNITSKTLEIPTRFKVTVSGVLRSDINPYWFKLDGSYIRLPSHYFDDTPIEPYQSFVVISKDERYEKIINIPLANLPSGNYIVKFLFHSYLDKQSATRFPNLWTGIISSNPIEVCLIH